MATISKAVSFAAGNQRRLKHSSTQVNRLFKKNPARMRVEKRMGVERIPKPLAPQSFPPVFDVKFLPNGWSVVPPPDQVPEYPFQVNRTRNKPNDGAGFLPVYAKFRKDGTKAITLVKRLTGDKDLFLDELRSVLDMPEPSNPNDDKIKFKVGGTIEIDGNRVREVKHWLTGLGF